MIKNVGDYHNFVPYMPKSTVFTDSIQEKEENGIKRGKFEANTEIGFSVVNMSYVSKVSYEEPNWVLSESYNNDVFQTLKSLWEFKRIDEHETEITYKINMTFNEHPLYQMVTKNFMHLLANQLDKAFEQRCYELYYKGD